MPETMNTYPIEIAEFNSAGIRREAKSASISHMREIGFGYSNGRQEADYGVTFYAMPDPNFPGAEIRVANTNGEPIWEETDPSIFAQLAEDCGVDINA